MKTRCIALATVAIVVGVSAGCSSDPPPPKLKHGVLQPGTAHLTIDDEDAGTTGSVECSVVGRLANISTGDANAGVTAQLNPAARLTVAFVRIRNLHHFSGDYDIGLGGDAAATVIGGTYHINGTAFGFIANAIAPSTHRFALEAGC